MTGRYRLLAGDVIEVLKDAADNSFDGLLCDPPYGLRFMGKRWDYEVPSVEAWQECLRVLKPGAPLLAFGGARTYHRLACGIEDAGFEIRDQLTWLYGKGRPASLNVGLAIDRAQGANREIIGTRTLTGNAAMPTRQKGGTYGVQVGSAGTKVVPITAPATPLAKEWDGYGTALKPGYEPIVLARKPLDGTMAANVARWGVGGLAVDACRNGERWPGNLLLDEDSAALLDAEVGPRPSNPYRANTASGAVLPMRERTAGGYKELGGPSRFFFSAKVSTAEREEGCDALPKRSAGEMTGRKDGSEGLESARAGAGRMGGARNYHPTLKPIALTAWLAKLIRPPTAGATLLVPFAGSGSEMIGALRAGWSHVVGIERDPGYVAIAIHRLELALDRLAAEASGSTLEDARAGQMALFGHVK